LEDYDNDAEDLESEEEETGNRRSSRSRGSHATNMSGDAEDKSQVQRIYSQSEGSFAVMTEYSRFWRRESTEDQNNLEGYTVSNVHRPNGQLMFRHFLESIVRLAHSSYSNLKGIEHMLACLLKKHILPLVGTSTTPETTSVFAYLTDGNIQEVFGQFQSLLWRLFKHNATGEGAYDRPLWALPLEDDAQEGTPELKSSDSAVPGAKRRLKRHFAGMQRRVHVQARMDVTIRVKDALHVLHRAGLLTISDSRLDNIEPTASLFPERAPRPDTAQTQNTAPIEELQGLRDVIVLGGLVGADGPGDTSNGSPQPPIAQSPSSDRRASDYTAGEDTSRPDTQPSHAAPSSSAAGAETIETQVDDGADTQALKVGEYLNRDFTVSFLRVLEILTQVLQSELSSYICWSLPQDPSAEHVALLDFLETELNFAEFQRLLLCIAELPNVFENPLPAHICLRSFLQDVFLPSLTEPYIAQKPSGERREEPAADSVEEPVEVTEPQVTEETEEAKANEVATEAAPLPETSPLTFWQGFSDEEELELALKVTPRFWPESYEDEVESW